MLRREKIGDTDTNVMVSEILRIVERIPSRTGRDPRSGPGAVEVCALELGAVIVVLKSAHKHRVGVESHSALPVNDRDADVSGEVSDHVPEGSLPARILSDVDETFELGDVELRSRLALRVEVKHPDCYGVDTYEDEECDEKPPIEKLEDGHVWGGKFVGKKRGRA